MGWQRVGHDWVTDLNWFAQSFSWDLRKGSNSHCVISHFPRGRLDFELGRDFMRQNTCQRTGGTVAEKAVEALGHKLFLSGRERTVSLVQYILDCSALSGKFQRPPSSFQETKPTSLSKIYLESASAIENRALVTLLGHAKLWLSWRVSQEPTVSWKDSLELSWHI